MAIDSGRIEAAVAEIIAAIGEDPARPGLAATPRRVAEAYAEFFWGIGADPIAHLAASDEYVADAGDVSDLVVLRDIELRSVCEHHLLPFTGLAHLAYRPGSHIVGLGQLVRVVDTIAARPQLQERLTEEIADALEAGLNAPGVLVIVDAVHGCVRARGQRQARSSTITMASRGSLGEPAERASVIALIGAGRDAVGPTAAAQGGPR